MCQQRFSPALSTNHLADLARLPFGGSVDAYMVEFQARAAHAGDLSMLQKARLFTGGLPEHIRVDVELLEPQDLQHAMRLARAYERRNASQAPAGTALGAPPYWCTSRAACTSRLQRHFFGISATHVQAPHTGGDGGTAQDGLMLQLR